MLDVNGLKEALVSAIQSAPFPGSASLLSAAIVGYVQANGTAKSPTISYILAPASGAGWISLIDKASSSGVGDYIISDGAVSEFAGSSKVIPGPTGVITVPMVFNTSAKVSDLSNITDFDQVWLEISKALIEFFKPEIE